MTTIAFDGRIMAADSQMSGVSQNLKILKIFPFATPNMRGIVGGCGEAAYLPEQFAWIMQDGGPNNRVPRELELLVITQQKRRRKPLAHMVEVSGHYVPVPLQYAIGSGGPYAQGAMAQGANAIEAVKVASGLDIGTGNSIFAYDFKTQDWVQRPPDDTIYRLTYLVDMFLAPENTINPQPETDHNDDADSD